MPSGLDPGEGVERGAQQLERQFHRLRQADARHEGGFGAVQATRRLGDLLGFVTDALEVGGDLDHRQHQAQVARGRLALGDDVGAFVIELDLGEVDRLVAVDDGVEQVELAAAQALERAAHLRFGEAAHVEDATADLFELDVVLPEGVFGHVRHGPVHETVRLTVQC